MVDSLLTVLEDEVQLAALAFMTAVYLLKVIWIMRFKPMRERTPAKGSETRGILYSYATLGMPWAIESSHRHFGRYIEFAVFHIGIAVTIAITFIIPYYPSLIAAPATVAVLRVLIIMALAAGLVRLWRRMTRAELRKISSPDDYFSLVLLNVYLLSAFLAAPNRDPWTLYLLFGMTTFFLVYVPFSKISHYLLWPFTRYYLGKTLGHRGVYPKQTHEIEFDQG